MRLAAKRLLISVAIIFLFLLTLWAGRGTPGVTAAAQRTTSQKGATMIRLYTGSDGQSHMEKVNLKMALNSRFGREESERVKVATSYAVNFPPGYVQDWHPASARRYVITLSGRGEIQLADGTKITLEPGSILQADDVTGKGHLTRTLGNEPWVAFFVEF